MSQSYVPEEIQGVLPLLANPDACVRRVALLQVADLADEAPAIFVQATRDGDAGVRLEAAKALEGNADESAVRALVHLLHDADGAVQAAAAVSLGEILDSRAGPVLLQLLTQVQPDSRPQAAILNSLRKLRVPGALAPALALTDSPTLEVRREAVGVLAYLKAPEGLFALVERVVADTSPDVRRMAAGALSFAAAIAGAEQTTKSILTALQGALKDEDWQVRQEAAQTLGKLSWPGAVPMLTAALDDSAWEVRLKAANALGKLKATTAVSDLVAGLDHPISNLRKEIVNALGLIGDPGTISSLQKVAAEDPDIEVCKAARRALDSLVG